MMKKSIAAKIEMRNFLSRMNIFGYTILSEKNLLKVVPRLYSITKTETMAQSVMKSSAFQPSAMSFSKLRKNKNGGKAVYILGAGNKKSYLQLPYMRAPFGLSSFTDEGSGKTSYNLSLSFDNNNPELCELENKLKEFDEQICTMVAENSKEWLGKKYNIAVIKEALYKPIVQPGKTTDDGTTYASTMKLKVLYDSAKEQFVPEAYQSNREQVSIDSIEKGQRVLTIVDVNQIWFIDNKFGVSVRLQQALLEPSQKLPSFAFQGVDGVEEEEEEQLEDGFDGE